MPKSLHASYRIFALLLGFLLLPSGTAGAALPPLLDAHPLIGEAFVSGRWQPVVITVTNQDTSDALTGEVRTSLGNLEDGASWIMPVTLPRGAGKVQTTVTLFVPENDQPNLFVSLRQGRDGSGPVVTRRTFDKLKFVDPPLALLAVTTVPDAISYLRGEKLGVENSAGVFRRVSAVSAAKNNQYSLPSRAAQQEVRVENIGEAGLLPGTAAGYDAVGIVYLGPDIGPDQFSDAQADSLRGWVSGGGLLVVASPSLRTDERFRTWIPVAAAVGTAGVTANKARLGHGLVASVTGDLTETGFGRSPAALAFWRGLAQEACSEPLVGNLIQSRGLQNYYSQMEFWQSVLRAPGLKAPPSGAIALFLLAYLLLLVPINYFILKRLDKREWTWATVPVLVTLFSVGAYGFGYVVKGNQMLQNTVSLVEMGANRGDSVVTASIGVFSPRQKAYDISTPLRDTLFWDPQGAYRYGRDQQEYGPMETVMAGEASGSSGVHVRYAPISMWAMRIFAARTYQIKMGSGVAANITVQGNALRGTIKNETGRALTQLSLYFRGNRTELGSLVPGEQKTIGMHIASRGKRGSSESSVNIDPSGGTPRQREFQEPILLSINTAMDSFRQREQEEGQKGETQTALLTAWNGEEIFPVKIDGQPIPTGTNLNLITVTIPVSQGRR